MSRRWTDSSLELFESQNLKEEANDRKARALEGVAVKEKPEREREKERAIAQPCTGIATRPIKIAARVQRARTRGRERYKQGENSGAR